ncbi:SusC/RagA family TonB-linked outer membrane protein [Labilibacter marinus]|uniref:SusC/RagA family TonB-linked outer membrane protein n=1 Tax=Labilibacter marinus TaxID=1477105 RepID=UPI0009FB2D2A|nr:TonB-dependent receptor [Labilibacter marinus]
MKKSKNRIPILRNAKKLVLTMKLCLFLMTAISVPLMANIDEETVSNEYENIQQDDRTLTGTVTDINGEPLPGVAVMVKGTTIGTITNFDGVFTFTVPETAEFLAVSFIGFATQELTIGTNTKFSITLKEDNVGLEEVVVVGYGVQKKESVVGSITQATGAELQKAGGVSNVGEALQGRLPGVTTLAGSGLPGESDPQIFIRGQSSWNGGGQPLILVDGIERTMSDIDMNEIDQMSVLKDASATAVFGVKGANGVILITTKRGKTGKAQLSVSANTTIKMISKLPEKLDSYDAAMVSNEAIMMELMHSEGSWNEYTPMGIADKYRNPLTEEERYKYPNVDWRDETIKDFAQDYRVNLSVRGGSDFAKYFGSLSYQSVRDIINGKKYDSGKGYFGEYSYDRMNYRTNIDFNITKSTKVSVNLSGFVGVQVKPVDNLNTVVNGLYEMAPNLYTPVYPDGIYGRYDESDPFGWKNSVVQLTNTGYNTYNKFQINSDFELEQKLDFITKGLKVRGRLSMDNNMSTQQKLVDQGTNGDNVTYRHYDAAGDEFIFPDAGVNDFSYVEAPWTLQAPEYKANTRQRRMNYEVHLNYSRTFAAKHSVSALFLWKREEFTNNDSMFPIFREDWVSRLTYNYDTRYFIDVNGAYNGSERFGRGYRFDLFPSVALGWMISNESFMSDFDWIDKIKVKGSYGLVGDDNFGNRRHRYQTNWTSGGNAFLVPTDMDGRSPYVFYKEASVGNPNLQWETAVKSNLGAEVSLWRGKVTADFDYFMEDRDNIMMIGSSRSVPDFYGAAPPDYNSGQVEVRGYELVLGVNHTFGNGINAWAKYNITDAKDEVVYREDPELRPFYQKAEGYPIGQQRTAIPGDVLTSWDDVYMSTPKNAGQSFTRVGYYDVVDFDGNGNYDSAYDNAPFGYPVRPQKTWTLTTGAGYKGINLMVMFYGTQNSIRKYNSRDFTKQTNLFFEHNLDYWSKENPNGTLTMPEWSVGQGATNPRANYFDSSVLRLKTVELSYQFPAKVCEKLGVSSLKVFANGNNLYLWSDLPDDREYNGAGTADSEFRGDYPTLKRFNFGLNLNF